MSRASLELFERARSLVSVDDVRCHALNDPSYFEYVAAYEAILRRGEPALSREFAVTEMLGITRRGHASDERDSRRYRWFRILTRAVEILIDDLHTPHECLAGLLVDSFALADAKDQAAPVDLLSAVCRELDADPCRGELDDARGFFVLGQLLLANPARLDPAAIEALCAALEAIDRRRRAWWEIEDAHWSDAAESDEFFWGLTKHDELHPVWLDLVAVRFPIHPPAALAQRKRLLSEGARWQYRPRLLS